MVNSMKSLQYLSPYPLFGYKRPSDVDEELSIAATTDCENALLFEDACQRFRQAVDNVQYVFGEKSNEYRYFRGKFAPRPKSFLDDIIYRLNQEYDEQQKQEAQQKVIDQERAAKMMRDNAEAAKFLSEQGLTPGVDFEFDSAWTVAYERKLAEKIAERGSPPYYFNGDDNCTDCDGWDGESRRCECGNRRVDWEVDGDYKDMYVYAQAW